LTTPFGSGDAVVMVRGAAMVRVKGLVAVVFAESVTWRVKLKVPETVGVPLRTPAEERVRLFGSVLPAWTAQV